jgi:2'-5' RNA ligase
MRHLRLRRPATWWPSIASRQEAAFRQIWQELRQHGTVTSGTRRKETWTDRAEAYIVCAIRVPAAAGLDSTLAPVRRELTQYPFVALYATESLHIVIQELGFLVDDPKRADETSFDRIEEFKRNAALPISDFPAFHIEVGGFNSFLDAPFLDVLDDGWCFRIHHRLRDFVLLPIDDAFAYLPHILLGRYTETADMGRFPAQMAPWRDRDFGAFTAETVDLLRISTANPAAVPEVIHSFELGHQRRVPDAVTSGDLKDVF